MRNDLTDVILIADRSGSMTSCRQEAENGINIFIEDQKKQAGECLFTLVQFDHEYEFVHKGIPIKDVPAYKLEPRGMTALLNAVGRAINETGIRLAAMPEDQRPGLVVFVIVTDGMNNVFGEFTKAQIKQMIEHQQEKYSWKFTFLGANQDAFNEGISLGISANSAAKYAQANSMQAYTAAASNVTRMRCATMKGLNAVCEYSDEERSKMQ